MGARGFNTRPGIPSAPVGEQNYFYEDSRMDDWTRVDLGARSGFIGPNDKPVEIKANIKNPFHENDWASSARGFLAAGAPRTFLLSASIDF